MSANSFGELFKITSFGESHGTALGVVIEGCPAGLEFDVHLLNRWLARRRPGQSLVTSARNETDAPKILSGVFEGKTLGTPICIVTENNDHRSNDYREIQNEPRIGHADDTWKAKFKHVDHRGGGRSSGRETVSRVMAGAVAEMICRQSYPEISVVGYAEQIFNFKLDQYEKANITLKQVEEFVTRFPSTKNEPAIIELLNSAKVQGQSYGGIVEVQIKNAPIALGQPVFRKLKSDLAMAILSIGATTGFELGDGFNSVIRVGTEFHERFDSNVYGGIRGGISTGEPILFRVAFKPTSSIKDTAKKGRHDPCIVTRAVPVVEAMTWIVLAEHILWRRIEG